MTHVQSDNRPLRNDRWSWPAVAAVCLGLLLIPEIGYAQMGGGMGPGGAGGMPQGSGLEKPKFRDHVQSQGGIPVRRENGDAVVLSVQIIGNKQVETHRIAQELQTRKDRFYDYETVLSDVRRLNDMGTFDHVTVDPEQRENGYIVKFIVHERPLITNVVYHGHRGLNNRELAGRAGLKVGDPLSEFAIESARRRLLDYYREEGFNQIAISTVVGIEGDSGAVIFRINEGPKERIRSIQIKGASVVSEARLKKIIESSGPMAGVYAYAGNKADLTELDADVKRLETYYQDLGFLTATAGRRLEYNESGKWLSVTFVINEGEQFKINDITIAGNEFITESSIRERLELGPGDMFNGTLMRRDIGEIVYGYGELGFIYAEVEPQIVMRDEANTVDLVYEIVEGDRWRIGQILVNIDGEPHLMRETTMLNLIEQREGDWINRRTLEVDRVRLLRSQLLETNPAMAEAPDITVVPTDDPLR